jgi:hypothetical protein
LVGGGWGGDGGDDDPFIVLTETKFITWGACTRARLDWEGLRCPSQHHTTGLHTSVWVCERVEMRE